MDHRSPLIFEVLVTTFLEGQGLSEDVPPTADCGDRVAPKVTDNELRETFRHYQARLAKLDLRGFPTAMVLAMVGNSALRFHDFCPSVSVIERFLPLGNRLQMYCYQTPSLSAFHNDYIVSRFSSGGNC
jgi:hypothetical protein